jgi:carboxylesterase
MGIRWQEWSADVLAGYELLRGTCDRVLVMGISLGGALALILASQQPVTGVIALSTPHRIADPRLPLIPLVGRFLRYRDKSQYKATAQQFRQHVIEEQRRRGEPEHGHRSYPRYPLTSILELNGALVAMRKALPSITTPVLFIMSSQDDVVGMQDLYRNLALCANEDKRTLILENSFHGITEDIERDTVFKAVADFVAEFSQ